MLVDIFPGDPSLRGGNGIPPRCVYLEEMAADLDGQDWLNMDTIEQVQYVKSVFLFHICVISEKLDTHTCTHIL